ncbi:MAG: tol-pal system protein YbgF [Proteobacteria bacterium]|nr:tol-pal system protein YbgF [Pseudomonadota bacterium]
MQKQLADLERQTYRSTVAQQPVAPGEPSAAPVADQDGAARAARVEVRLGQIEDAMRMLTGRVEEVGFRIDTVVNRIDKLIGDVDFRLSAIEKAQAKAVEQVAAAPASEPGTLGTVPLSALSGEQAAAPTTPALPAGTPKQQYDYAFSLLRQQEYAEAERALTAFIDAHPDDSLTGNAYYWLAETYYVRRDYQKAAGYFASGYRNFPEGAKATDNLLKLAMSLANIDQKDKACFTFKELAERFPDASSSIKQRAEIESRRAGCG